MALIIGQGHATDHDFDQPLGLLSDCHRRIEHFLSVLLRVAREFSNRPLTSDSIAALNTCKRYFASAAPKHTADEEESLFPRMRKAAAASGRACDALDRLESDHQDADVLHSSVDGLLEQWLSAGTLALDQAQSLITALERLERLYVAHIQVEDREVFPLAAQLLDAEALADVGQEMKSRRGLAVSGT